MSAEGASSVELGVRGHPPLGNFENSNSGNAISSDLGT